MRETSWLIWIRPGTDFEFGDVFCFTDFLSGFLFRVRGRARVKVGDGGWF